MSIFSFYIWLETKASLGVPLRVGLYTTSPHCAPVFPFQLKRSEMHEYQNKIKDTFLIPHPLFSVDSITFLPRKRIDELLTVYNSSQREKSTNSFIIFQTAGRKKFFHFSVFRTAGINKNPRSGVFRTAGIDKIFQFYVSAYLRIG